MPPGLRFTLWLLSLATLRLCGQGVADVTLNSGQHVRGPATFENGALVLRRSGGPKVLRLAEIASAIFSSEATSRPATIPNAGNGNGSLPPPWGTLRIGKPAARESCIYSGGLFTLRAASGELRGTKDSFYFVAQPLDGDGQITARIGDVNSDAALAGVSIRDSLAADSPAVTLVVGKESGAHVARREIRAPPIVDRQSHSAPCYLRIDRIANTFRSFISDDDIAWRLVSFDDVPMSNRAFVGLLAANGADAQTATITADHVRVTGLNIPLDAPTSGVRCAGGSFLSGKIAAVQEGCVDLLLSNGRQLSIPLNKIARIAYHALPKEMLTPHHGRGLLLTSGDFLEGDPRPSADGRVRIDSVVFGEEEFSTQQVLATLLRDVVESPHATIQTRDGSTYTPQSAELHADRLTFTDDVLGSMSVGTESLKSITLPPSRGRKP